MEGHNTEKDIINFSVKEAFCHNLSHNGKPNEYICLNLNCSNKAPFCCFCLTEEHHSHQVKHIRILANAGLEQKYKQQNVWIEKMNDSLHNSNLNQEKFIEESKAILDQLATKISRLNALFNDHKKEIGKLKGENMTKMSELNTEGERLLGEYNSCKEWGENPNNSAYDLSHKFGEFGELAINEKEFINLRENNRKNDLEQGAFRISLQEVLKMTENVASVKSMQSIFNKPFILGKILEFLSYGELMSIVLINKVFLDSIRRCHLIENARILGIFKIPLPKSVYISFTELNRGKKMQIMNQIKRSRELPIIYTRAEKIGNNLQGKVSFRYEGVLINSRESVEASKGILEKWGESNEEGNKRSLSEEYIKKEVKDRMKDLNFGVLKDLELNQWGNYGRLNVFVSFTPFSLEDIYVQECLKGNKPEKESKIYLVDIVRITQSQDTTNSGGGGLFGSSPPTKSEIKFTSQSTTPFKYIGIILNIDFSMTAAQITTYGELDQLKIPFLLHGALVDLESAEIPIEGYEWGNRGGTSGMNFTGVKPLNNLMLRLQPSSEFRTISSEKKD